MEIQHIDNGVKGAFYIEAENVRVAEMTYSHAGPNKIIIDHTEVNETLKGQGVGYKLVDAAVEYLRANNLRAIPLCPFANAVFKKKHDQYKDVLA
ncbi:GNAT family N-acetyltransferase [Mariniflexile sp.]|uniref:GNAT family N-acetyltransferase n=1 Tax=Mariniflexile sp. TaxID=1979402 RepID=UPI00404754C9